MHTQISRPGYGPPIIEVLSYYAHLYIERLPLLRCSESGYSRYGGKHAKSQITFREEILSFGVASRRLSDVRDARTMMGK